MLRAPRISLLAAVVTLSAWGAQAQPNAPSAAEQGDEEPAERAQKTAPNREEAALLAQQTKKSDLTRGAKVSEQSVSRLKSHAEGGGTVASTSPLTPVVPDPKNAPRRAFQLYWQVDVPVFAASLVLGLGRIVKRSEASAPPYCTTLPDGCSKDDLTAIDRPFAGRYSPAWAQASDIGLYALAAIPIPLLAIDEGFLNALNDAVVIYEATLLATALGGLATLSANRARPFVYGDDAPLETRQSPDAALSFISGHATASFALSTSLFWAVERRRGFDLLSGSVLALGTATAGFVSYGRVAAGKHFPTDVVAGMIVGSAVGTLIPFLHETPVTVVPEADKDKAAVSVQGAF